ncbi:hypothetical protein TNCV_4476631 [Trichonephila clavipes]|nr:hypothetical protein TNCV_4476631 [Trichonephila clavipes]
MSCCDDLIYACGTGRSAPHHTLPAALSLPRLLLHLGLLSATTLQTCRAGGLTFSGTILLLVRPNVFLPKQKPGICLRPSE